MKNKINVLIVGGGMYVSGCNTDDFGTILPAVLQAKKNNLINKIIVCAQSLKTVKKNRLKFNKLKKILNLDFEIDIYPLKKNDKNAYLKIINKFKFDCAIVSVPDHLHSKVTINLMKKKINCLVVKPMTTKLSEAINMYKIQKLNNLIGQVEFHKRYDEANIIIKNKIKNNLIGNLQYINVNYSQKKIIPTVQFKKWSMKSNIFQYLGVHYIDLISFITNYKPKNVTAWGLKDLLKSKKIDTWDSMHAVIEWKKNNSKFISIHSCNWIESNNTTSMSDQKISFVGTKGKIDSDQKNRGMQIISDESGVQDINPYFSNKFTGQDEDYFDGYGIKSINNFLKDVFNFKNKLIKLNEIEDSRPSFKNSLITVAVTDAITKSIKSNNKKINITFNEKNLF